MDLPSKLIVVQFLGTEMLVPTPITFPFWISRVPFSITCVGVTKIFALVKAVKLLVLFWTLSLFGKYSCA